MAAAKAAAAKPAAEEPAAEEAAEEKPAAEKVAAERAAAERAAAEKAAAEKAAALGLLQPLEALSLDADSLRTATAAAVTYCDAQGADSFADLVERASRSIVHPHRRRSLLLPRDWSSRGPGLWPCDRPQGTVLVWVMCWVCGNS